MRSCSELVEFRTLTHLCFFFLRGFIIQHRIPKVSSENERNTLNFEFLSPTTFSFTHPPPSYLPSKRRKRKTNASCPFLWNTASTIAMAIFSMLWRCEDRRWGIKIKRGNHYHYSNIILNYKSLLLSKSLLAVTLTYLTFGPQFPVVYHLSISKLTIHI